MPKLSNERKQEQEELFSSSFRLFALAAVELALAAAVAAATVTIAIGVLPIPVFCAIPMGVLAVTLGFFAGYALFLGGKQLMKGIDLDREKQLPAGMNP
jgi:hypothetical protein